MSENLLPPLDENGLLPIGIHLASLPVFEQRFVLDFPLSVTRRRILDGYKQILREITPLRLTGWQWLDGSFVTAKENPEDLDVVTFLQADELDALSAEDQTTVLEFLQGQARTKALYHCETFLVIVRPFDDRLYQRYEKDRADKNYLFGKTNFDKTGVALPKGFVSVALAKG